MIPIPPKLDGWYHLYQNTPETIYASNTSIEAFLNLDYAQFIAVKDFLHPEAQYSTEHGVKGEEYDNVIFVISKGWNQYQFETYAPMITKKAVIPSGKQFLKKLCILRGRMGRSKLIFIPDFPACRM